MSARVDIGHVAVGEEGIEPDDRRELGWNYQAGRNDYARREQRAFPVIYPRAEFELESYEG